MQRKRMKKAVKTGKKVLREAAKIGKGLAMEAKDRVANELSNFAQERIMSREEAQKLLKELVAGLREEQKRVSAFAKQELDRTVKKAKPFVKKAMKRVVKGRKLSK